MEFQTITAIGLDSEIVKNNTFQERIGAQAHAHFAYNTWLIFRSFLQVWEAAKVNICCLMHYIIL